MGWLEGYVALVTGGGSGMGRAVVERFVREGARVGVLERSAAKLHALEQGLGDSITVIEGDVTSWEDNCRAVEETVQAFGKLDTFIGNAGLWDFMTPLVKIPGETLGSAFDELFGVNVKGYLLGARAAVSALLSSRGSMIFTVSNAAFDVGSCGPLYCGSKHAVAGVITELAYELAPKIRVNGVAPGGMPTTDLRGPKALGLDEQSIAMFPNVEDLVKSVNPLQIVPRPEDNTGPYVLLASRENSSATTGSIILCDGGLRVRGITEIAGGMDL